MSRVYNLPEPPRQSGMTLLEALWVVALVGMTTFFAYANDNAIRANQEILNSKLDSLCELHVECLEWREDA